MKPTLVTGATGFLGWHVARKLLERGDRVRVLVRDPKRLRELEGVDTVCGDLRDRASLDPAVRGCGVVFHIAADYRLWSRDANELFRSNVDGTRNVLQAARDAGVEKCVYTSTVGCIGVPENGVGSEENPVKLEDMSGPYKRSKFLAEQVALEFSAAGFPVTIVNPTAPVGDHDFKPTPTGRIVVDYLCRRMPAFLDTGLNVVDARDTALGHLLACEKGRPGERYILGCMNMTLREIFGTLEGISGIKAPTMRIPYAVALVAGYISTGWAAVSGREPRAPLEAVRMAKKKMFVTHAKAARELGYQPGPAKVALERAVGWFQANGYVQ